MSQVVKTPGYNCRIAIFFQHDKNGRKNAYYWTNKSGRAIRVGLADAEMWVAQDLADLIPGHPLKPLLSEQVEINNQPYTVVARTRDELAQESLRLQEERTVSLPELDTFAASMQAAREEMASDPYWTGPEPVKNFYNEPDIAAIRESMDAYLEKLIIQRNLVLFFQAVNQYINQNILGPDVMIVRGTCGHRYLTKFVDRADLMTKRRLACHECQPREEEGKLFTFCQWCGSPNTDGKKYCNEECAKWDSALSCGILPSPSYKPVPRLNTDEPY